MIAAICAAFCLLAIAALIAKLRFGRRYGETSFRRGAVLRISRLLYALVCVCFALTVLDRAVLALVSLAIEAAEALAARGVEARVLDMHTIKPLDKEAVADCIDSIGKIITVEDHNILNGLGSAVCEVAAEAGKGKVKRIGIQDQFGMSAPYERLLAMNGVTVENIVDSALSLVK